MIDFNALAIFVRVAEAQSFTAAARRLDMPISTVSRRVSELEKVLEVRLLERSTRRLRLTEVGAELFEAAQGGLEAMEGALRAQLDDHGDGLRGMLRLSAPPSLSDTLLAPALVDFQRLHPEVRISCSITDRRPDFIADGLDLAIRIDPSDRRRNIQKPLLTYRHILVASPAYLAAAGPLSEPADLAHHRILAFAGWPEDNVWMATDGRVKRYIRLEPILALNDYAGVVAAARSGHGVAEAPPFSCLEDLKTGALVEVLRPWRLEAVTMSTVQPRKPFPSRLAEAMCAFLADSLSRRFPELPS